MSAALPWHEAIWQELLSRARGDRLPHALLFSGSQGVGKRKLAIRLAHSLLCQTPKDNGDPCGQCQACGLIAADTHPDLLLVEPEEEGKAIPVDRIRAVGEFLALKGQYGGRQIVIIQPAEAMNRFAANSLLKTLEEPSADALLILVTSQPSQLLPTIRSRCQQMVFPRPAHDIATAWLHGELGAGADVETLLSLTEGAPLAARDLHQSGGLEIRHHLAEAWLQVSNGKGDPLACAASWGELGLNQALYWLGSWIMDLIRLKSGAPADAIVNGDLRQPLQQLAERVEAKRLFAYLEQITEYTRMAGGQLNAQLALEDIMINWSQQRRS
jgi:DNA polymerase-3 subunit delta'